MQNKKKETKLRFYPQIPYKTFSKEEEILLIKKAKEGHQPSRDMLIYSVYPLLIKLSNRWKTLCQLYKLEIQDLQQEAVAGVIHAIKLFNPEKNTKFSSYSSLWMNAFIRRYIESNMTLIKKHTCTSSRKLMYKSSKIKEISNLKNQDLKEKYINQIIKEREVSKEQFETYVYKNNYQELLTSYPAANYEDNNTTIGDNLTKECNVLKKFEEEKDKESLNKLLHKAFTSLTDKEQKIIKKRYLEDENLVTLQEIANMYKISRQRVNQIEEKILIKLKKYLVVNHKKEISEFLQRS